MGKNYRIVLINREKYFRKIWCVEKENIELLIFIDGVVLYI